MKYQLVLQFAVSESTDFDELIDLESQLIVALAGRHVADGHDFGSGEMNIFVYTDDPQGAFHLIKPIISATLGRTLKAAFRALSEDNYQWIYPEGSQGEFTVI